MNNQEWGQTASDPDAPWHRLLASLRLHPPSTWPPGLASSVSALVSDTFRWMEDEEPRRVTPDLRLVHGRKSTTSGVLQ